MEITLLFKESLTQHEGSFGKKLRQKVHFNSFLFHFHIVKRWG